MAMQKIIKIKIVFTLLKTKAKAHKKTEFLFNLKLTKQISLNGLGITLNNDLQNDHLFKLFNYNELIFTDVTAIDHLERIYRFSVLYTFLHLKTKTYTFLNLNTKYILNPTTYTAAYTYFAAIAAEREIFDLFGIFFTNHPDLRRILTDYSFIGHPLRKDYSLMGSKELIYSGIKKIIKVNSIFLNQEFRNMEYNLAWVELA